MIIIEAPHPNIAAVIVLRNPDFQDSRAADDSVNLKRAMDGTQYSTVKRTDGRKLFRYHFILTREKALEFETFHGLYVHKQWKITDFDDNIIVGTCKTNPLNLQIDKHEAIGDNEESVSVELEFCGIIQ